MVGVVEGNEREGMDEWMDEWILLNLVKEGWWETCGCCVYI